MKYCKKCSKEFTPKTGLINYCSLSCRNSRERSLETKRKIGEGVLKSEKFLESLTNKAKFTNYKKVSEKLVKVWNEKLLKEDFNTLSFGRLRKRVILEQSKKCNHCGIDSWNQKPIVLELEHIDGNSANNTRSNLEALCPNCHSQTKTWRGKNKKGAKKKVVDEEIVKAYIESKNVRQTLLKLGISAKGGNYNRVYAIIKKYEL